MGNYNTGREVLDNQQDGNKKIALDIESIKNKLKNNDEFTIFIENTIPPTYLKDFKHFALNYRIKKNTKCHKDLFYKVKLIEHTRSGRLFNLKIINRSDIYDMGSNKFKKIFTSEIKALSYFKHPQIESLIDVYFDRTQNNLKLYLILNYTPKLSLLDLINQKIKDKKYFDDKEIAVVIKMLIEIIFKFKTEKFIYRNICADNIYFLKEGKLDTLCLRNFYFSIFTDSNPKLRGIMGPLAYMAPEMVYDSQYDFKLDTWSIGIIAYMMVTLDHPLIELKSRETILEALKSEKTFKSKKELKKLGVNQDAINLLYKMLVENKENRFTPEMLLQDKFLKDHSVIYNIHSFADYINLPEEALLKLRYKIENLPHLHNIIYYIYFQLRNYFLEIEEIMFLNELFKYFDKNNDGMIKFGEIEEVMKLNEQVYASGTIHRYVDILKAVNDTPFFRSTVPPFLTDCFTYEFFLVSNIIIKMYVNAKEENTHRRIEIIFREIDIDNSGYTTIDEIQTMFTNVGDINFIKNSFQAIMHEETFDSEKIPNFEGLTLKELKNLFLYKCIKLTPMQKEEIQIKRYEKN